MAKYLRQPITLNHHNATKSNFNQWYCFKPVHFLSSLHITALNQIYAVYIYIVYICYNNKQCDLYPSFEQRLMLRCMLLEGRCTVVESVGRIACALAQIQCLVKQWTMSVASIPVGCMQLLRLVVNCLCVSIVLTTNYQPVVSNSDACLQGITHTSLTCIRTLTIKSIAHNISHRLRNVNYTQRKKHSFS